MKTTPEALTILVTLAKSLRRLKKRVKRADEAVTWALKRDEEKGGPGLPLTCYEYFEQDQANASHDSVQYALYLAKASVGRYKKTKFGKIPSYGEMMTLEIWIKACDNGLFINFDGSGDLATADECSDFQILPSERHLIKYPDWATHVVWYNK